MVSTAGLPSDWSKIAGHVVVGRSTLPPDAPSASVENGQVVWTYPDPPVDHAGFRLRYHYAIRTTWENAIPAHEASTVSGAPFPIAVLPGGQLTVMIKAVDDVGLESANAAVLTLNLGDPIVANVVVTKDFEALSWPGTIVNGTVVGDDIVADDTGGTFWNADTQPFWSGTDSADFWTQEFKQLIYIAEFAATAAQIPGTLTLTHDIEAESYRIDYRPDGVDLMWTADGNAFWSGTDTDLFWADPPAWVPWPGTVAIASIATHAIQVTCAPGFTQSKIKALAAILDVPDVEESFQSNAIIAAGTRLSLTKTYRAITGVNLTVEEDGGGRVDRQGHRLQRHHRPPGEVLRHRQRRRRRHRQRHRTGLLK